MDFTFNDDQLELRAGLRQVLERYCQPSDLRKVYGGDANTDRSVALSELGLAGALVGPERGGLGLDAVDLIGAVEELGYFAVPEPLTDTAWIAGPILAQLNGSNVDAALKALVGDGQEVVIGGVGVTPTGTTVTTAARTGGAITPNVNGAGAPALLLAHEVEGESQLHLLSASAVELETIATLDPTRQRANVSWRPGPLTMVARGPEARRAVVEIADRGALAVAAQLCGLADRMITMAADYAKVRHQFGKPIGSFQAVKHHLANARVRLEFARPMVYRAAWSLASGDAHRAAHISMAKSLANDTADLSAEVALQVHGAIGYTWECDLQLYLKRAWSLLPCYGDAATHRAKVLSSLAKAS